MLELTQQRLEIARPQLLPNADNADLAQSFGAERLDNRIVLFDKDHVNMCTSA